MRRLRRAAYAFFHRGKGTLTHGSCTALLHIDTVGNGKATAEGIANTRVRVDRISPHQTEAAPSHTQRSEASGRRRLASETAEARHELRSVGGKRTFGDVCEAYRAFQKSEGKRSIATCFRIDIIESILGNRAIRCRFPNPTSSVQNLAREVRSVSLRRSTGTSTRFWRFSTEP